MARTDRKTLEKIRMRVLAYLGARTEDRPGEGTSFGAMARSLALTESRIRNACRALEDEGLLISEARFDEDGGQRANRYIVTSCGWEALRSRGGSLYPRGTSVFSEAAESHEVQQRKRAQ